MTDHLRYEVDGSVATLHLDDGKVNALGPDMVAAILEALERAEADDAVRAVVIAGRAGRFCAGFDLRVLMSGADQSRPLVEAGSAMFMRAYGLSRPVVAACTGHALAGGALLLLCSDARIGAAGDFKIGLNEVAIGIDLPVLVQQLASDRLDRRRLFEAIGLATIYDPAGAAEVGYLDEVVPADEVLARARQRAQQLARLPRKTFARSKASLRQASIARIEGNLKDDLDKILAAGKT